MRVQIFYRVVVFWIVIVPNLYLKLNRLQVVERKKNAVGFVLLSFSFYLFIYFVNVLPSDGLLRRDKIKNNSKSKAWHQQLEERVLTFE